MTGSAPAASASQPGQSRRPHQARPRRVGQGSCTGTRWLPGKIIFIPNEPGSCASACATANPGWRTSGTSLASES